MPLSKNTYVVKEHVGIFKAANNYDIYDPDTGDIIMECREPNLGIITKLLRFTDYKTLTPFEVVISDKDGKQLIKVKRGMALFTSCVKVYDGDDQLIGSFKQKFFSVGGAFKVHDEKDNHVCDLKGKWTSWEFGFKLGDMELAKVSKKWAGLGKELFTSADNYALNIADCVELENPVRKLIVAAVVCIDMVLKEA